MIEDLKKIELHLHLDGSVHVETIVELSGLNMEYVKENMIAHEDCHTLREYLEKFSLPLKYMQTKENLERISRELVSDLEKDNVIYAEIRFAPKQHQRETLSIDDIILSVLKGLHSEKVKTKLILCMMRGDTEENNLEVIHAARKYNLPLDLAGGEGGFPNTLYPSLFTYIHMYQIPFTVHSGEARGKESVLSAIQYGANRIGHGIRLENDPSLIKKIIDKDILLEICPTSNIQTHVVKNIKDHPIYEYYKAGIPISINTDNRTVSNITLNEEYHKLMDTFPFTIEDFEKINEVALSHAFLKEEEKEELREKLKVDIL